MQKNNWNRSRKRGSFLKVILVFTLLFFIVTLGVLVGFFVNKYKESKENNFGDFKIISSDESIDIDKNNQSIELLKTKIGQECGLKFNAQVEVNNLPIYDPSTKKTIPNGVYIRLNFTAEIYDIGKNGEKTKNSTLQNKLNDILSKYMYTTSKFKKSGKYFYFIGSTYDDDRMLCRNGEVIKCYNDISIVFPPSIIDGSWYEKSIKITMNLEVCDYLSPQGLSWKVQ